MLSESKQSRIIWVFINYHRYYYTTSKCRVRKKPQKQTRNTMHMHLLASGTGVPSCQMPYKEAVLALNGLHILTLDNWKYQVLN